LWKVIIISLRQVWRCSISSHRKHTVCPWKGTASYYDVEVNGKANKDAAWFYPDTKSAADNIKGYVAFWRGVEVVEG